MHVSLTCKCPWYIMSTLADLSVSGSLHFFQTCEADTQTGSVDMKSWSGVSGQRSCPLLRRWSGHFALFQDVSSARGDTEARRAQRRTSLLASLKVCWRWIMTSKSLWGPCGRGTNHRDLNPERIAVFHVSLSVSGLWPCFCLPLSSPLLLYRLGSKCFLRCSGFLLFL